jgi:3',5'-cyclic-AMP phosphodiesterase
MLVAQITDTHISEAGATPDAVYRTAWHLERAVRHLTQLSRRPDAVIVSGDLVDAGSPGEYVKLRRLLAPLAMPVYLIPGNHDDRDNLRAAFADWPFMPARGFLHYTVEHLPVRFVFMDTHRVGEVGGEICPERLAWLDARLSEQPRRPTVIVMHHPPFLTGIARMDEWGLIGLDAFGDIVARHGQIERILCGHLHRPMVLRWRGTVVSCCPSTAHQMALDLEEGSRKLTVVMEPPACQLHSWSPAGGLISHLSYVGEFAVAGSAEPMTATGT